MGRHYYGAFPFLAIIYLIAELISWSLFTAKASQVLVDEAEKNGTRWAVLVAGSNFYYNYRHQADVCHAYQILKKGGLKDENIIVFMYDDIAFNKENPRRGIVINKPNGPNVYQGVPKDYTGKHVTANNFYAVILGNKSALTGGSGKVVNSGPNDHIFIYYSDHGGPGVIEMPVGRRIYAKDLVDVLKKKHAAKAYKSMVFYLEACESGSIFDGLLPNNFSIFATTAANERELSYATYCPKDILQPSPEYGTCLGDMFSISWLEDCDKFDLSQETFERQYEAVRRRTLNSDLEESSHVMKYGDLNKLKETVSSYMGSNPANDNFTFINDDQTKHSSVSRTFSSISQRDASLLHFWHKFHKAPAGSRAKIEAQKQVLAEISRREHIDNSITQIGHLLFGYENSLKVLKNVRPQGQPLVDDWDCFKMQVNTYEKHCGRLSKYGMQYMRAFANMCNFGVTKEQLVAASIETCSYKKSSP